MGMQGEGHYIKNSGNVTMDAIVFTNTGGRRNERRKSVNKLKIALDKWNNGTRLSRQKSEQKKKRKIECFLKIRKKRKEI